MGLKTNFKDFQFFNYSEAMTAILCVGQGHRIQFWKRTKSKFAPVVLGKIKMWKDNGRQRRTSSDGKSSSNPIWSSELTYFALYIYLTIKGIAFAETSTFSSLQISLPYSVFSPPIIVSPFPKYFAGPPKIISIGLMP